MLGVANSRQRQAGRQALSALLEAGEESTQEKGKGGNGNRRK